MAGPGLRPLWSALLRAQANTCSSPACCVAGAHSSASLCLGHGHPGREADYWALMTKTLGKRAGQGQWKCEDARGGVGGGHSGALGGAGRGESLRAGPRPHTGSSGNSGWDRRRRKHSPEPSEWSRGRAGGRASEHGAPHVCVLAHGRRPSAQSGPFSVSGDFWAPGITRSALVFWQPRAQ